MQTALPPSPDGRPVELRVRFVKVVVMTAQGSVPSADERGDEVEMSRGTSQTAGSENYIGGLANKRFSASIAFPNLSQSPCCIAFSASSK